MKRVALLVSLMLAVTIGLAGPATAGERITTMHGAFTSGTGLNTIHGTQPFGPSGRWNVALTRKGPVVTGILAVSQGPCEIEPCWFMVPLSAVPWEGGWVGDTYVLEARDQGDLVKFDFTLTIDPDGIASMHVAIRGCPYGWTSWHFTGASFTT